MIQLHRSTNIPTKLLSTEVAETRSDLARRVSNNERLTSKDFKRHWGDKDLRQRLWIQQHKKCCYTERHRNWKLEMDVEHFRPKTEVTNTDHPGYWWLAYEWANYLLSSKPVNSINKRNHFPLMDSGIRAVSPDDSLDAEHPVLIDPYAENPELFIRYQILPVTSDEWWVFARGRDREGRGERTIEILGLNEQELVEERGELVYGLGAIGAEMESALNSGAEDEIQAAADKIRNQTQTKLEFAGFRRRFFRDAGYGRYVDS